MKAALYSLVACVLTTSPLMAQNLFVNPGFEDPITMDGPPFIGSWEGFNSGAGASSMNSITMPRSGSQHLDLAISLTENAFAGAFQDVGGLTPGTEYVFSGWHATPSTPLDLGVEFRIEWRDSVNDVEISRTPNSTSAPTSNYSLFSLSAAVPAGADLARVVYAIQTFGPGNNGIVFVDDVSFGVVPEPSSVALLGLGGLAALFAVRRRRS